MGGLNPEPRKPKSRALSPTASCLNPIKKPRLPRLDLTFLDGSGGMVIVDSSGFRLGVMSETWIWTSRLAILAIPRTRNTLGYPTIRPFTIRIGSGALL